MKLMGFIYSISDKINIISAKYRGLARNTLLALVLFTPLTTCHYVTRYIEDEFDSMAQERAQSIALSIEVAEKEMEKTLNATAEAVKEKLKANPKLSTAELTELAARVGVTTISILNGNDGKFFLTSGGSFDPNNQFYKELSLLDINQCATQKCGGKLCREPHEVRNCQMKRVEVARAIMDAGSPVFLPIYRVPLYSANPERSPAKWVVEYDRPSGKIIDIFYTKQDLGHILERNIQIYKDYLKYISLADNNGNLIMDSGHAGMEKVIKKRVVLEPRWNFVIDGKNIEYFYVLTADISTARRDIRLITVRVLFTLIEIAIILLIFTTAIMLRKPEKI